MEKRTLGTGGLEVSALGFGAMGLPGLEELGIGARYPEHLQKLVGR